MEVLGRDVLDRHDRTEVRRRLGYLPQTLGYFPGFTVREFVEYVAWLKEVPRQRVPAAVDEALELVGLQERAGSRMRTLSGGMLRRAGVAQAIVNKPELLLLDEPTSTVLVSTHLVEDVASACTGVALVDAGRVVFTGTPADLASAGTDGDADTPSERGYLALLRDARS